MRRAWLAASLGLPAALAAAAGPSPRPARPLPASGGIHTDLPAAIDPEARYLFYLHGRILEVQGRQAVSPDFGRYEYDAILGALAGRGFTVISEVRTGDAGPEYAEKVAGQVRGLLEAGVPADRVTVVGASKGGALALRTAASLGGDGVNVVVLAGCGPFSVALAPQLRGRILSIYDASDRFHPSCAPTFAGAPHLRAHREVVLSLGLDHGLLYHPRKEWLDLVSAWAEPGPVSPPGPR